MNTKEKGIAALVAGFGLGAVIYLLTKNCKGEKNCKTWDKFLKKTSADAAEKLQETRENVRETVADKVFSFAVDHRQSIASVASLVLPYLLKNFVKKKL